MAFIYVYICIGIFQRTGGILHVQVHVYERVPVIMHIYMHNRNTFIYMNLHM